MPYLPRNEIGIRRPILNKDIILKQQFDNAYSEVMDVIVENADKYCEICPLKEQCPEDEESDKMCFFMESMAEFGAMMKMWGKAKWN